MGKLFTASGCKDNKLMRSVLLKELFLILTNKNLDLSQTWCAFDKGSPV